MTESVVFFKQYPFVAGEKIHIDEGPRKGDWIVMGVNEKKVELRCPVSGIKVSWDRFCYFVEERVVDFPAN